MTDSQDHHSSDGIAKVPDFGEFTETAYADLLGQLLLTHRFEPFGTSATGPHVLWRHDIDFSVHRAVALARLEAERGIVATYFVLLHSPFYNVLERGILDRVRLIADLGHRLGLHFEAGFYADRRRAALTEDLVFERQLLERLTGADVNVFSFHNPALDGSLAIDDDVLAGMINTYGRTIQDRYRYVSDSNGFWRLTHLPSLLRDEDPANLHVLTHPEWWTPEELSPRARIARAIDGRAAWLNAEYDDILVRSGRPNVR